MLWPFKRVGRAYVDFTPVPPDPDWNPPQLLHADSTSAIKRVRDEAAMRTAEWHAFHSMQLEAAGDPCEAREHLKDAGDFLAQIGGPCQPKSAEEIYQWCAARRALET